MNLDELIAAINSYANIEELTDALKTKAKRVYQIAFNDGHAVATGQAVEDKRKLNEKITTATAEKDRAVNELQQFKSTSNVEELRKDYDKKLADKDSEILRLQNEKVESDRSNKVGSVFGKVQSGLKAVIDDDKADALAEKKATKDRIKFDETTNRVQVLQSNGVPFAGTEDEQVAALVEELKTGVPDVLLKSTVDAGTGRESVTPISGTIPKGKKGKEFYQKVRDSVRKPSTPAGGTDFVPPEQQLNKRLGLRER